MAECQIRLFTCPALTTGPSLQPSSIGSEILMFLHHFTSLSKNSVAMLSWNSLTRCKSGNSKNKTYIERLEAEKLISPDLKCSLFLKKKKTLLVHKKVPSHKAFFSWHTFNYIIFSEYKYEVSMQNSIQESQIPLLFHNEMVNNPS